MRINALMMDGKDNVVTCICNIEVGQVVYYKVGDEVKSIVAKVKFYQDVFLDRIFYCYFKVIKNIKN